MIARSVLRFQRIISILLIVSLLSQPVSAAALVISPSESRLFPSQNTEFKQESLVFSTTKSSFLSNKPFTPESIQIPPAENSMSLPLELPTPSGAKPAYPTNHMLDGINRNAGTLPTNSDFENSGSQLGAPPTNHDLELPSYDVGSQPTNNNFDTGNFTGWTVSPSGTSIQTDTTYVYYAKLQSNGVITTAGFTIDPTAQQLWFDAGYWGSSSTLHVWVHSGANYATETQITKQFSCSNCGEWHAESFDLSGYTNQSIKVRFRRHLATVGIDNVRQVVLFPNFTISGDVQRSSDVTQSVYARLGNQVNPGIITTSAFIVANSAQVATVKIKGLSSQLDQYRIVVLSGANFATSTVVNSGNIADDWDTLSFNISPWQGQSIKLRVERQNGVIGVDEIGVQSIQIPGWQTAGVTYLASHNSGLAASTNGSITSDPFFLEQDAQQMSLLHRHAVSSYGTQFAVSLLHGSNFQEESSVVTVTDNSNVWQPLTFTVAALAGQFVRLKLTPLSASRFEFDDISMPVHVLPGWQTTEGAEAIATGDDRYGSFVKPGGYTSHLTLQSNYISTGIINRPSQSDARYYAISYDIGYNTGSLLTVRWNDAQGQSLVVFSDAANSPTGYRTRYFPISEALASEGYFSVYVTNGGKVYSVADNIARQHANEPFSFKVGWDIDTATGSYGYVSEDVKTEGRLPIAFTRYYRGHSDQPGVLGYRWSHSYEIKLVFTEDGDAGVVTGAGREAFFDWNPANSTFRAVDARVYDTLAKNVDGSYSLATTESALFAFSAPQTITYTFNTSGTLTSIRDANNNVMNLNYSANNQLTSVVAPGGGTLTIFYDSVGRIEKVRDPMGGWIIYGFETEGEPDSLGDLRTVQHYGGPTEFYEYDRHQLTRVRNTNWQTLFENQFDDFHRVIRQVDPLSHTIAISYSTPAVGVTTAWDPNGNQQVFYFDRYQRTTDYVEPRRTLSFIYDGVGNMTKMVEQGFIPVLRTSDFFYNYGLRGNITSMQDALGNLVQIHYDTPEVLPTDLYDGNGNHTSIEYDNRGNIIKITDPLENITLFAYDSAGNRTSTTDALGRVTTFTYNGAGNMLTRSEPGGVLWQWTYNDNGKVTSEIDPEGNTTTYFYDLVGRIIAVRNALNQQKNYLYDNVGNLIKAEDELGRVTLWDYDERGLVEAKIDPAGKKTHYAYDANRNMIAMTDTVGLVTHWEFNDANQVTKLIQPGGAATIYSYDSHGNLIGETNPLGHPTTYVYNQGSRLTEVHLANGAVQKFEYDNNRNLTRTIDPLNRSNTMQYDALNRRVAVTDRPDCS